MAFLLLIYALVVRLSIARIRQLFGSPGGHVYYPVIRRQREVHAKAFPRSGCEQVTRHHSRGRMFC